MKLSINELNRQYWGDYDDYEKERAWRENAKRAAFKKNFRKMKNKHYETD